MRHASVMERKGMGDPPKAIFLVSAPEFRVEGDAERQPDVILRLAAEAGHEVVELEQADRDYVRSLPVLTTTQSCGKGAV